MRHICVTAEMQFLTSPKRNDTIPYGNASTVWGYLQLGVVVVNFETCVNLGDTYICDSRHLVLCRCRFYFTIYVLVICVLFTRVSDR